MAEEMVYPISLECKGRIACLNAIQCKLFVNLPKCEVPNSYRLVVDDMRQAVSLMMVRTRDKPYLDFSPHLNLFRGTSALETPPS